LDFLAKEFAEQKGFEAYFKTSALFGSNVKNVFDEAIFKVYQARCDTLGIPRDREISDDDVG
jgi:hypothetical protein